MKTYMIFTDGGGNVGPGSWSFLVVSSDSTVCDMINHKIMCDLHSGYETETTNNRMEMQAVINAISYCEPGSNVIIFSDSKYVQAGFHDYMKNWIRLGWRLATSGDPVKNQDLWQILHTQSLMNNIHIFHGRGHNKDSRSWFRYYNDIVDKECTNRLRDTVSNKTSRLWVKEIEIPCPIVIQS